ncbi:hypothetical protein Fmac_010143 [Flemingia macrophylla]|uniref:Leucine-rich repeat domain, L domain-containing protein n=1 Tax=Flemingia macrophylla TaxID=520843 RepID=A0ABD1N2F3_9FABA
MKLNLVNLKEIDLESSIYLTDIPDLSKATKLDTVYLHCCKRLHELHLPSLSDSKLRYLNLGRCSEIKSISVHSKYLRQLWLHGCSSLKQISVASEEITELSLCGTAITSFLSISSLPKLKHLDLSDCKEIERLDLQSESLELLNLQGCSSLTKISITSDELIDLRLVGVSKLESLNVNARSLQDLYLRDRSVLKEISVVSEGITILVLSGTIITSFSSISSLPKLTCLDLSDCKKIERLDLHSETLEILELNGCLSLKEISVVSKKGIELCSYGDTGITSFSSISSLPKLTYLDLSDCKEIEILDFYSKSLKHLVLNGCSSLKEISVMSKEITKLDLSGTVITSLSSSISSLSKLTYLDLSDCKEIERLDLHSKSLKHLVLNGCSSLKEISVISEEITILDLSGTAITSLWSSISSLSKLTYLDLSDCKNLVSLGELPSSALYGLNAFNCISLETEITQHLVLQHMLQTTIPYLHQSRHRKLWDRDSDVIDYFVFPGDHVIDECVFQTRESSISIPYYELKMNRISGFIYCIVLSQGSLSLSYEMLVSILPIWHTRDSWGNVYKYHSLISDHVVFWYHDFGKFIRMCKVYHRYRDVEIKFELLGNLEDVKGFGVFPVYVTTSGYKLQISGSQFIEPVQPSTSKRRRT